MIFVSLSVVIKLTDIDWRAVTYNIRNVAAFVTG